MTDASQREHGRRRIELSLVLEFGPEQYLGADGEVNEDIMRREVLDYAAEAARNGDFNVEVSLVDEQSGDA